jgi:hypothetical protein
MTDTLRWGLSSLALLLKGKESSLLFIVVIKVLNSEVIELQISIQRLLLIYGRGDISQAGSLWARSFRRREHRFTHLSAFLLIIMAR